MVKLDWGNQVMGEVEMETREGKRKVKVVRGPKLKKRKPKKGERLELVFKHFGKELHSGEIVAVYDLKE